MAKIKLNLPTGVVEDKTLVTAFEEGTNKYIILDADSVGSMGLPIILVCKINENRIVKITDQTEWNSVKGFLKEIIQGNSKKYITISDTMDADETYFTQLTLPVASFETIKKAYLPIEEPVTPEVEVKNENEAIQNQENVAETIVNDSTQVAADALNADNNTASVTTEPTIDNVVDSAIGTDDTVLESSAVVANENLNLGTPAGSDSIVGTTDENIDATVDPILPDLPVFDSTVNESSTENTVDTVIDEVDLSNNVSADAPLIDVPAVSEKVEVTNSNPTITSDDVSSTSRDAFLKACGDMFDALISAIKENK